MKIDILGEKLARLMNEETELLDRISAEEEKLQRALRDSSWNDLEIAINRLSPLSEQMEKIEQKRDTHFQKIKKRLNMSEQDGFYAVAAHLDGSTREDCLKGYRKMKVALLRMRGLTSGIDQYVRTVGDTSRTVLNEVFPHRKGNIYSNNGVRRPAAADPMVLNRHL